MLTKKDIFYIVIISLLIFWVLFLNIEINNLNYQLELLTEKVDSHNELILYLMRLISELHNIPLT